MSVVGRALSKFTTWALSKNGGGSYRGENDGRWAYTINTDGSPYLTRVLAPEWLKYLIGCRPYLHHFHREDGDRHLHNHPWAWAFSIVLSGSYDETRLDQDLTEADRVLNPGSCEEHRVSRRVRWFNYLTRHDYHKVDRLRGDVWTLFVTGPRLQDWGFLVDGQHVPWREYLGLEAA